MYKEPDWLDHQIFMFVERELAEWIFGAGFLLISLFLSVVAIAFVPLFGPIIASSSMVVAAALLLFWPAITVALVHLIDWIATKISLDKS